MLNRLIEKTVTALSITVCWTKSTMAAPSIGQLVRSCVENAFNKQIKMNKLINNEVHDTVEAAAPTLPVQLYLPKLAFSVPKKD